MDDFCNLGFDFVITVGRGSRFLLRLLFSFFVTERFDLFDQCLAIIGLEEAVIGTGIGSFHEDIVI